MQGEPSRFLAVVIIRQSHEAVLAKLAGGAQRRCLIIKLRCLVSEEASGLGEDGESAQGKEPTFGW